MSNNSYYNDQWRIINESNQNKVSNYSCAFDGTGNEQISIPPYTIPENSTVSFWVKSSLTNPSDVIISGGNTNIGHYYPFLLLDGGNIKLLVKSGSTANGVTTDVPWAADTWFHIAITGENGAGAGSTATFYINGINKGTSLNRTPTLSVIGNYSTLSLAWNGQIDQVCFFDYVLPATGANSIATLYGGGTAVTNPMSLSPAPVAYYQLGDQSVDNGANYLVPNNSLQDYVFSFDETDDYIDLSVSSSSSVPSEQSSWTYSAWLYLDSTHTESFPTIFQRGQGYPGSGMLVRESAGNIQVFVGTALSNFTVNKLLTNTWSHFALAYDLSTNQLTLYINNLSQTLTMTATWSILTTLFNIGFRSNNTGYWKGEMSNVQVFNTALPSTGSNSIETIYNNGSPLTSMSGFTSIQSWYKLNAQDTFDGTDWTIKDSAGSNDGTSNGMDSSNLVQSDLQHTSGYSPYALNFDGTDQEFDIPSVSTLELYNTDFSISFWCKVDASVTNPMFFEKYTGGGGWSLYIFNDLLRFYNGSAWTYISGAFQTVYADLWTNVTIVGDLASTNIKCYINGGQVHSSTNALIQVQNTDILTIAGSNGGAFSYAGGLSNIAIWSGTALSAAEVTEVYNQGAPIDLNTFSGNKPNHWWQMGSNSSFNSSIWTCLDEGISASTSPLTSAVSTANMANDDIINGVGYSGNGLGTSSIDIVGDAPYSSGNGLSENMDVLDRVEDVPG